MAVLNFPSDTSQSPYEENGITYEWDGQKWIITSGGSGGGAGGDLTLQEVTDNGNITTNGATFGDHVQAARLTAEGTSLPLTANRTGGNDNDMVMRAIGTAGTESVFAVFNNGDVCVGDGSQNLGNTASRNIALNGANGSAEFTGEIEVDGVNIGSGPGNGINNTRVGDGALGANTTGASNTALGRRALENNDDGSNNTGVGHTALGSNINGSSNTAVGVSALFTNNGADNTAVGAAALQENATGIANTAVGRRALVNNTGSDNIAVGAQAGQALTNGNNNTILGNLLGTAGMANTMLFGAGTTERFRVDGSGRFMLGTTTAAQNFWNFNNTYGSRLTVEQSGAADHLRVNYAAVRNSANSDCPFFVFGKSRGTTSSAVDIVQDNDRLGSVSFQGADGTNFIEAAAIRAEVEGTPGTDSVPGRLTFSTNSGGAVNPIERVRIDSNGNVGIGDIDVPEKIVHIRADSESVGSRKGVLISSSSSPGQDTGLPIVFTSDIGGGFTNYALGSICARKETTITTGSDAAGYLQFATTATGGQLLEQARITSTGRIILSGTTPEGIQFGSTNSGGNITSQTLNDYEEGTWTPRVLIGASTQVLDVVEGFYRKIGNLVFVRCKVSVADPISDNGPVEIRDLPFFQAGGNAATTALSIQWSGTLAKDSIYANTFNSNRVQFMVAEGGSVTNALQHTDIADDSVIGIAGCYEVS